MTTLPIEGTLKEAIFLKRANWAVSSFSQRPFAILRSRSRGGCFRFSQAEFPALRCGWAGQAVAGPGQVAVAFWARSEAEGWACSGGSRGAAESSNLPGSPRSPRHTMASGGSQSCEEEEEEEALKKLIVRLNNVQEGKQMDTLLQLLEDMLVFTYSDRASKLFEGKNFHVPLLIVLDSYMRVASVQQVKDLPFCSEDPYTKGLMVQVLEISFKRETLSIVSRGNATLLTDRIQMVVVAK